MGQNDSEIFSRLREIGEGVVRIDERTRRIYHSRGTGAFSYGNDLKYPIPAA